MNLKMKVWTVFIALGCTAYSLAGEEQTGEAKVPKLNPISFQGKSMRKAIRELSSEFKERICFEEVQLFPKTATKKQAKDLRFKKNLGVSLTVTNTTIRSVFERDLLGLSAHDVNLELQFGKHSWLDTKVFLDEANLSARIALNKLSVQLEPKMRREIC